MPGKWVAGGKKIGVIGKEKKFGSKLFTLLLPVLVNPWFWPLSSIALKNEISVFSE